MPNSPISSKAENRKSLGMFSAFRISHKCLYADVSFWNDISLFIVCNKRIKSVFISSESEVDRYCYCDCFEYSEINRRPFKAVEHEYRNLLAFFDSSAEKHIGYSVCFFIKYTPCDFTSVWCRRYLLNKIIFLPGFFLASFIIGFNSTNAISSPYNLWLRSSKSVTGIVSSSFLMCIL